MARVTRAVARLAALALFSGAIVAQTTQPTNDLPMKFDPSGKLVRSFGGGLMVFPHGIHMDHDGNV